MAKFFITNEKEYYNSIKRQVEKTDFTLSFDFTTPNGVHAIAVHKLGMQNVNAVSEQDDFCIATGTCIYKESLEYRRLLREFDTVSKVRQHIIGQYAVSIKKDKTITIFGDTCNCYDIYYWHDDKRYIVSNSLYEIVDILQGKLTLNPQAIVERALQRVLLNGETYFKEIHCLQLGEIITIDIESSKFEINQVNVSFPIARNFDKAVHETAHVLRENARVAVKVLGRPTVCVTGGLDSRMMLAAYLSVGGNPKLIYGKGHMHGQPSDEKIAKMYAQKYGLELVFGDMSLPSPTDRDWDYYIKNHGFAAAGMWGASGNLIKTLTHLSTDCLNFGWGGELYRDTNGWFGQIERDETFSLQQYFEHYYNHSPSIDAALEVFPHYLEEVLEHLKKACEKYQIDINRMTVDENFILDVMYEGKAETQVPLFMQQMKYCYLLEFEYNALQYRVPFEMKRDGRFQLSVIKALYEDILEVPIFSCCQWRRFDATTMTMQLYHPSQELYDKKLSQVLRAISPKALKQYVLRPLMHAVFKMVEPRGKREDFEIPTGHLRSYIMDIKFPFNELSKEDHLIYSLLIRTLMRLGY